MEVNKKEVGNRIKDIRYSFGDTQIEFAKRISATVPAISNWENAINLPNNERLKTIANLRNITVDELLYGENKKRISELKEENTLLLDKVNNYKEEKKQLKKIINTMKEILNED